jgi:thiamine biosynthesis lipoprotein ApbE
MGCDLVVDGGDFRAALTLFRERERLFSSFEPDTELNRVNASNAPVVEVSREFARAVRTALHAAATTDGIVDLTVGRWPEVEIDGRTLRRPPGLRIDLTSVVRSQAVDDALQASGARLVSLGDELAVSRPSVVPLPGSGTLELAGGGVANVARSRPRAGAWQHDGGTSSRWDDVTVAAESCLSAGIAAKAAFALSDDGPDWLDDRDLPGRFRTAGRTVVNRSWRRALTNFLGGVQAPIRHAVDDHVVPVKAHSR